MNMMMMMMIHQDATEKKEGNNLSLHYINRY